jgi:hypothetical protein
MLPNMGSFVADVPSCSANLILDFKLIMMLVTAAVM